MDKKEFIIPFSIITLSTAFAIVCVVVFLTKGKSSKWMARKMRIGAMLLTLSAVSCNNNGKDDEGGLITCYLPAPVNNIVLDAYKGDTLKIRLDTSNVLVGSVYGVTKHDFSFAVVNQETEKIQKGSLVPDDGSFDTDIEKFKLELDKTLAIGVYDLQLFESSIEAQENTAYQMNIKLQITEQ